MTITSNNFTARQGSVLLQTLVMCVVLSFIAVTLTQWILARYSSASKTFYDTSAAGGYMEAVGRNFSINVDNTTKAGGSETWYTQCYDQQSGSISETGISYSAAAATNCANKTITKDYLGNTIPSQSGNVYQYEITMPSMQ